MIKNYMLGFLLLFQTLHAIPPHGTAQTNKITQPSLAVSSSPQPISNSILSSCLPTGCVTECFCCIISYLPFKNIQTPYQKLQMASLGLLPPIKDSTPGVSS